MGDAERQDAKAAKDKTPGGGTDSPWLGRLARAFHLGTGKMPKPHFSEV
jgi:hypothetical protein